VSWNFWRHKWGTGADEAIPRKFKIPDYQNGQVYLTSHRICYVDNADPRKNSTAIDLKDVDHYEFYVCLAEALTSCGVLVSNFN
jgi:hypothetical protein